MMMMIYFKTMFLKFKWRNGPSKAQVPRTAESHQAVLLCIPSLLGYPTVFNVANRNPKSEAKRLSLEFQGYYPFTCTRDIVLENSSPARSGLPPQKKQRREGNSTGEIKA